MRPAGGEITGSPTEQEEMLSEAGSGDVCCLHGNPAALPTYRFIAVLRS